MDEFQERAGFGIRGTGGFASRSRRFGFRSLPMMPPAGLGCPGPGAYEAIDAEKRAREAKHFSQASSTAVFQKTADPQPEMPAPGPGHYAVKDTPPDAKELPAAVSAFKSTSLRMRKPTEIPIDVPGPGNYNPMDGKPAMGECPSANFKEPSGRRIVRIHPELPTSDARGRELLGPVADEVGRTCVGTQEANVPKPGPGHYEQDREQMWNGGLVGTRGSSSFLPGQKRTDWATEDTALAPGPGKYEPKKAYPHKTTDAASAFVSRTERNKYDLSPAPGPAYYAHVPGGPPKKKSFRMRSADFFVA